MLTGDIHHLQTSPYRNSPLGVLPVRRANTPNLYSTEVKTMWNIPSSKTLQSIPALHQADETPFSDKDIYLHFYLDESDWYIAEYDGDDLFWGYAILNGDYQNAEWGIISFSELLALQSPQGIRVACDYPAHWKPVTASKISEIVESGGIFR
jgi:hypothetical protein